LLAVIDAEADPAGLVAPAAAAVTAAVGATVEEAAVAGAIVAAAAGAFVAVAAGAVVEVALPPLPHAARMAAAALVPTPAMNTRRDSRFLSTPIVYSMNVSPSL